MDDAKLIDLVEAQPSVYDKTDIFYSNKEHVRSIWKMIAGEMQQDVTVCQKRWRYLRDYFVRQLHITEDNNILKKDNSEKKATSFGGKRSYWPLYERLSFLKPFSLTRPRMKRILSEEVTSHKWNTHDEINSQSMCSEGSDRSTVSTSTPISSNHVPEDMEFLKFYQAMQMAAQQNFKSTNEGSSGYQSSLPVDFDGSPPKEKIHQSDLSPFQPVVDYAIDEHECFFKSILSSVRRISDEHIIGFRMEVLQALMKFRNLSETTDTEASDLETNEELNGDDDVVVINTGEAHWRKNLFPKKF